MAKATEKIDALQTATIKLARTSYDAHAIVCLTNEEARRVLSAISESNLAGLQERHTRLENRCREMNQRLLRIGDLLTEEWET